MRLFLFLLIGCTGGGNLNPDLFGRDTDVSPTGCRQNPGAEGEARLVDAQLEIVLTPRSPDAFRFVEALVVSGAETVSESIEEQQVAWTLAPDGEVTLMTTTACSGTVQPAQFFFVDPAHHDANWQDIHPE
ncbi:MAG: hypothetical protein EP330_29040 [Deltaproteobacteria bacterium]|nr:MAG: hypothetical protein EP330_29040 [Deltaproteobacteria bacterium]